MALNKSVDAISLAETRVRADWTQFARAIRPATGPLQPGWHTGAGALSNLEWIEGGNNDDDDDDRP